MQNLCNNSQPGILLIEIFPEGRDGCELEQEDEFAIWPFPDWPDAGRHRDRADAYEPGSDSAGKSCSRRSPRRGESSGAAGNPGRCSSANGIAARCAAANTPPPAASTQPQKSAVRPQITDCVRRSNTPAKNAKG